MRTFINRSTKITGFGIGQDRIVVTERDVRVGHAARHLATWHASRLWHGLYEALLALKQVASAAPAPAYSTAPRAVVRDCRVSAVGTLRSGESMRLWMPLSVNG
jgi:hypothetical protein